MYIFEFEFAMVTDVFLSRENLFFRNRQLKKTCDLLIFGLKEENSHDVWLKSEWEIEPVTKSSGTDMP